MRLIAIIAMAALLTACGSRQRNDAPAADADVLCYQACTTSLADTGVRWQADPADPSAWDELGEVVVPELSGRLITCEASRRACVDFIQRLRVAGVITAPALEPEQP